MTRCFDSCSRALAQVAELSIAAMARRYNRPYSMTLAIRADANAHIGAGHVMRSIALGEAWQRAGGEAVLFTVAPTPLTSIAAERRGISVRSYGSNDAALDALVAWAPAHAGAWVALDSYDIGRDAHRSVRAAGARLLVIDDCATPPDVDCDILLNQNIGVDLRRYRLAAATRCCFGPEYALIRDEFRRERLAPRFEQLASRLVVTFGGADVHDQARRVARVLTNARPPVDATIVAGQAHASLDSERVNGDRIHVRWQPPTEQMASVLAGADMAVCAAGSTCWELAHLGVPALTLVVADNQLRVATGLHDAGVIRNLGWFDAVSDADLASAIDALRRDDGRAEMSRRGRALVDGRGADRVVEAMRLAAVEA
jgi:UDP-2,4-diacetamido-2,4,6-trideoxy-beta-L-altropyranose hydrolase